jgi:hypothetical protein
VLSLREERDKRRNKKTVSFSYLEKVSTINTPAVIPAPIAYIKVIMR